MDEEGNIADMAGEEETAAEQGAELQQIVTDRTQQDTGCTDPAVGIQPDGRDQRRDQGTERTGGLVHGSQRIFCGGFIIHEHRQAYAQAEKRGRDDPDHEFTSVGQTGSASGAGVGAGVCTGCRSRVGSPGTQGIRKQVTYMDGLL